MAWKNATECFGDIHFTLPNGREVVGKVPTLKQQLKVMELLEGVAQGKKRKQSELISWFPKLVGLEAELNQLTYEEFFDVVQRFFGRRGSGNSQPSQETTNPQPELNDSLPNTPDTTADLPTPTCVGVSS